LIRATTPFWSGMSHPGVAVESLLSSKNFNSYYAPPMVEAAWQKLYGLSDQKDIIKQVKEVSRLWHEEGTRSMLWAMHGPIGLSPRVKTYNATPGRLQIVGLEYLELKN
jgi:ABC-type transport system substrate-binding protein